LKKIHSTKSTLAEKIAKAVDFHGHLGPFLVIGVRMADIGMRELGLRNNNPKLRITAHLKYSVPISCIVDGLQVTTKCTIGNQKLKLIESSADIAANFVLHNGKEVTVAVNPAAYDKLKSQLISEKNPPKEIEHLAKLIASMPEEDLFIIRRNF